jgi:hypothetical protein
LGSPRLGAWCCSPREGKKKKKKKVQKKIV